MKHIKFNEWLDLREGMPANWKPTARLGHDPMASAFEKINRGMGNMPFNGNFTSPDVIKVKFGFDDQELAALDKLKLIKQDGQGYNIDQHRFQSFAGQLQRQSSGLGHPSNAPLQMTGLKNNIPVMQGQQPGVAGSPVKPGFKPPPPPPPPPPPGRRI